MDNVVAFERESYLCYQGIRLQRWRRKDLPISQPLSDWIDHHVHVCLYTRVQFTFPSIFSGRGAGERLISPKLVFIAIHGKISFVLNLLFSTWWMILQHVLTKSFIPLHMSNPRYLSGLECEKWGGTVC